VLRAALAALLLSAVSPAAAQPAGAPQIRPVPFTQRTLANGLRVYAIRDTTTPNVAVQVWYDVGGRDDPRGRSGFAHLFEHLMFKATRNLVPEQFDRLTEDVGGYNNASTSDDYTNYYELVPANHLERLLFAEADRMASLVVEPTSFASERDVVKEEYRQGVLSQPYGKLEGYLAAAAYRQHPYARGVIGSIDDLDAATIDDVRAFHATYYRPDNAVLIVAGNFDPAALDGWVDRHFAKIARPARAIPRVAVVEPPRDTPVAYTVREPNTPLPAVALSFPVPPDRDADTPALMVLDAILSRGESSRLYQALVYRAGLAQSADTTLDTRAGPGMFNVIAIAAGGKDAAALEAAMRAELARVRDVPVSAAELAEAKTEIVTAALKGLETAEGKAQMIAASVLIDGDPRATERQLEAVAAVSAADVQRVARAYLAERRAAVIRYLPAVAGAKPGAGIAIADTVVTHPLDGGAAVSVVTPAPADRRAALPALGSPAEPTLPNAVATTLSNGLTLITVERHDVPLVSARLVATGGAVRDAPGKAGTASLAAQLLTKGTATRSATQIAAEAEALGASLGSAADRDGAALAITVGTSAIAPALTLLADAARHPALAADELERLRAQAIDRVAVAMSEPLQVAALVADRAVFAASPYGAPVEGTAKSLAAITPADIRAAYRATWTPGSAALILVGDVTPTQAKQLAETAFGDWQGSTPPAAPLPPVASPTPRVIVIDMPDAGQAGVVVANPGVARRDAAYFPVLLAGTVLGGGFSSRLNAEIRIKRGLSYGAGTDVEAYRTGGAVASSTRTKNASAPEVVAVIAAEMARLGTGPVPGAAEIESRKSVLTGGFGRSIETTSGLSAVVASQFLDGLPSEDLGRYTSSIRAVEAGAVRTAAARLFDPAQASIVVAGDARQFLGELRKTYPALTVIPASALDLDKATLP